MTVGVPWATGGVYATGGPTDSPRMLGTLPVRLPGVLPFVAVAGVRLARSDAPDPSTVTGGRT